jgi:thioester reductase-like protein
MMQPAADNNEAAASQQHAERAALEQQALIESLRHDLQLTLDPPVLPEAVLSAQSLQELYDRHALSPSLHLLSALPSDPVPASASALPQEGRRHVLLTGATGFLGGQTLWHILGSDDSAIVHCLVRNPSQWGQDKAQPDAPSAAAVLTIAKHRLERSLRSGSLWRNEFASRIASRIVVYPSALDEEMLGLSPVEYALLSSHVDTIVHAAAEVNWVLPYSAIRASNVVATQQLLRFAAAAAAAGTSSREQLQAVRRQAPVQFVHVSTTSVGRGSELPLLADSAFGVRLLPSDGHTTGATAPLLDNSALERVARRHPSGYALSKWCAEWLVLRSGSSGQAPRSQPPSSHAHHLIVRPGFIGPHSSSGHSAPRDFLTRYLATVMHTKLYVASSRRFDFTTVDQVAQQLWTAATEQQRSTGDVPSDDQPSASSSSSLVTASVPAATTIVSIDSSDAPPSSFPSYTQLGEVVSRALSTFSAAADADAASMSRTLPSPCSAEEFVAAVARDPTAPLYPLLHVISAPGYFGLRTGPQAMDDASSAAAGQEEPQQKSMHLIAIERCVQRLLTREQELE